MINSSPAHLTQSVSSLPPIPLSTRQWLVDNPERLTAEQLNHRIPELNLIEVENTVVTPPADPTEMLTIVAWNLERGRYWSEAVELIQTAPELKDPDLLLLSEMDYGMARSNNRHTTREVARALDLNYAYVIEFLELTLGSAAERQRCQGQSNTHGFHGNAILSRYPLHAVRALRFPGIQRWYDSDQQRIGGRVVLMADIQVRQRILTVTSVHLESGLNHGDVRDQQSRDLVEELDQLGDEHHIIVGGDFNAAPSSRAMQIFRAADFTVDTTNDCTTPTLQDSVNGQISLVSYHVDYILTRGIPAESVVSPAIVIGQFGTDQSRDMISDHAAIAIKISLP